MRVLVLHNSYQTAGGEDVVVEAERSLLEANGHTVRMLAANNHGITSFPARIKAGISCVYSRDWKQRVLAEIRSFRPDVVHVHNFFPLLSPSVYYACREAGAPVVQTLHNFRLVCPNALLFRQGRTCEDCVGKSFAWPGVVHACYKESRLGTAAVASMLAVHRRMGTWTRLVDAYIALTDFARDKLIEGGLPAEKVLTKPNFVDPDIGPGEGTGGYALFVGRLSGEKGIEVLLAAWERLEVAVPLKIVGDGPLWSRVADLPRKHGVEYWGRQPKSEVVKLMRDALFLVFPSTCYEGFAMVIAEAFSAGLPVIASDLGSMSSLISNGRTGLHFRPGDPDDLAAKIRWAVTQPEELARIRLEARAEYKAKYTACRNYQLLMSIYDHVIQVRHAAGANL